MLKTTISLPCLRVNSGLVKADDVGSGRSLKIVLQLLKGSHISHTIISAIETIEIIEIVRVEANTSIDEVKALQKLKSSFQLEWRSMCSTAASIEWNWVMNKAGMHSRNGLECNHEWIAGMENVTSRSVVYGVLDANIWCIRFFYAIVVIL
ncbi:unnamed protein product [Lactuca saligna]|uniref:Uncharacterized protein n=1 Tax=Lactuca saligna TaxID=75948 RepID=A0AA35ZFP8_LACSI|nr:unnamed protein product [Lactuca saligna]